MATKELMTRIQSKIATLAEWEAVKGTFKPLRGEICIAEIPQGSSEASTAPTTLIKIGDGTNYFKDLTWLSAKAADVQNFLKVDSKGEVWTQAKFEEWIKSLITIDDVDTSTFALKTEVQAVDAKAEQNKSDIAGLTSGLADANTEIGNNTTAIDNLSKAHGEDKVELEGKITTAQNAANDAQGAIDGYISSNDAALDIVRTNAQKGVDDAATAQAAAEAAQQDVDELAATVNGLGNVYDAKGAAETAESNAKAYTEELADGQVKLNKEAIEKLNGNDQVEGSVDYKIAHEVAKILNDNDATDIDTLNEIAAWITNDTTGAAKMNKDIADNAAAIEALNTAGVEKNTIVTIKKNGEALAIAEDRSVNIEIPTGALASKDKVAENDLESTLATKINGKVDTTTFNPVSEAVTDHGDRIADLEAVEAEKNVIVEVQLNGNKITPDANRAVNIELGDLASKDKVAKADLGTELAAELDAKATTQALTDGLALKADKSAYDQTVADLDAAEEKIAAFETRFGTASDVLIFNCGSSTVNV